MKRKFKLIALMVFVLFALIFSSCTVSIGPITTNYTVNIRNMAPESVTVEFSGGLPDRVILAGGTGVYSLPLGTVITVRTTILPPLYFAIDDIAGQYNFTLDGAGYTLFAEPGFFNIYSLRVTRVL